MECQIRGVIVGIKKKSLEECDFVPEESSKKVKVHDLDFGLDMTCTQPIDDDISRKLKDKEEEVNDLKVQLKKMRLEFEAYKKQNPVKIPEEEEYGISIDEQVRYMEDHPEEFDVKPEEFDIKPKPVVVKKTLLSLIDDSDEEGDILSKSSLEVNKIVNSLTI